MNEELLKKMLEYTSEIETWARATKDFLTEQTPLVIYEIIYLGLMHSLFPVVVAGIVMAFLAFWVYTPLTKFLLAEYERLRQKPGDDCSGDKRRCLIAFVFITRAVCFGVPTWVALANLYYCLEILVAPRIYVLQQLAELARQFNVPGVPK